MEVLNDTRNRTGYVDVAGLRLRYVISQATGEQVSSVRADILKGEQKIGGISIERDGRMYISIDKGNVIKTSADRIAIVTQTFNDAEQLFNEPAVQTLETTE